MTVDRRSGHGGKGRNARSRIAPPKADVDWLDELKTTVDFSWRKLNSDLPELDDEGLRLSLPAPNAIEWVVGKEWCDVPSTYGITGQYEVIRDFFELRCPLCNTDNPSCTGKTKLQLQGEVLLRYATDYEEERCPKCGTTRSEFLEDGFFKGYNQMHLVIGQRAGKSICAALIGTYIEHSIVSLGLRTGGFGKFLEIDIPEPFEITFLAATDVQSSDTIWAKFTGIRGDAPWFRRYVPWVKLQQELQLVPTGMKPWEYKETDKKILNMHPAARVLLNSLNSNAPGLRGRTRPAAFADEISHMDQTDSKRSATEVYRALERSLRTVRSRTLAYGGPPWLGLMASVTSPVSRNDKGMELLRTADRVPRMFVRHMATWEFNPKEPRKNLDEEYAKDPIGAARDYGARPPGAAFPLIHDESRFRTLAVDKELIARARFEPYAHRSPTGQDYVALRCTGSDFITDQIPRFVVWDAGVRWDAFAGACAHGETIIDGGGNARLVTVFDWIVRILPRKNVEVFFDSVRDLMHAVRKTMPIARCEFDRWQSFQLIQQIREMNIFAEQSPTTSEDYVQFRVDAYSGLVRLLPPLAHELKPFNPASLGTYDHPDAQIFDWAVEPPEMSAQACALYEILGAQCDPDTHKVTFPEKGDKRGYGSNDVCQVMVHAHKLVQKQGYTDRHDDRSARAARIRAEETSKTWDSRGYIASIPAGVGGVRNWNSTKRGW